MKHPSEPDTKEPVTAEASPPPSWNALWSPGPYVRAVYDRLVEQYAEPHRAYHTMTHIRACLAELERTSPVSDVCRIALWFHDCYYEPRAVNNEWRSAVSAANMCRQLGRPELCEPVKAAVLATKHNARPESWEACLVVDADLSILGAEAVAFDAYERGIRIEYAHVPEEAFRAGRAAILKTFLERGRIYETDAFRDLYEVRARENLVRSIERLA